MKDIFKLINWQAMPNIILTGVDGVGKTTLANWISDNYGHEYVKCSVSDGNDKVELAKQCLDNITHNTIFDRFYYPDEIVYSQIFNDDESKHYNHEMFKEVVQQLKDKGFTVVWLVDDIDEIKKRFEKRGDDFVKTEQLKLINVRYQCEMLYVIDNLPVLFVDIQNGKVMMLWQ